MSMQPLGGNLAGNTTATGTPQTMNPLSPGTVGSPISTPAPPSSPTSGSTTPNPSVAASGELSFADVENYWVQAGGNQQAAAMAAAVADASSGLNPNATYTNPDGSTSIGLWLIPQNGTPPGSTDPLANARAAVQISSNGTDWSAWCTAWSDNDCGLQGGTYLGQGSNVLGALGGTGAYQVNGAQPTGSGTSAASTATTGSTTPTTSSSSKTMLVIVLLIAAVVAVMWAVRRKMGEGGVESQGRSQASWSPAEEAGLSSNASDKELSAQTGRSVRAIRVRRNQMKSR